MGISAGIAAFAAVAGANEQRKAGKAQRKSEKLAQRKADIQSASSRRKQVRAARVQRAEILSNSANSGAAGSSSESGALSGLQTTLGTNLGESFAVQNLSQQQSKANSNANRHSTQGSMFASIGSAATSFIKPDFSGATE
jgi:hypothetical protein